MSVIKAESVPETALLHSYVGDGNYSDCYRARLDRTVDLADYIYAFYSTPLFEIERTILKWAIHKPSTRQDILALADGTTEHFAAWSVEARRPDELLLSDYQNRTRSWLKCVQVNHDGRTQSDLYFGSAIVLADNGVQVSRAARALFYALLPFHQVYSRGLLWSARLKLND